MVHPSFKSIEVKQVDCGQTYQFVLTEKGELYGWGSNAFKQLGLGDATNSKIVEVKKPKLVEFFTRNGIKVKQVSCSKSVHHNHTGCVTEDGRLFMWGDPYKGQLGHYKKNEEWTHKETNLYSTPLEIDISYLQKDDFVTKVENAGIHSSFITEQG